MFQDMVLRVVNHDHIDVGIIETNNQLIMSRTKSENGNGFVTIASKVSKEDKRRVKIIADAFGMSFYELLQSLIMALIRYFDSGSVVTYNHNCMMNALANTMYALKGSFSPLQIKNRENRVMKGAIIFVEDSPKKRPQLLSVCKNDDGLMIESFNYDKMVSDFLNCIDPDALQRLESQKKELGYFSITHTLHDLIMQRTHTTDGIKDEIEEMFSDVRLRTGQTINDDTYYKRGYRKNVDEYTTIPKNPTIRADF